MRLFSGSKPPTVTSQEPHFHGGSDRTKRERILAAVELNLSNSKLEGLILWSDHESVFYFAEVVIAMVYLCRGGLTIELLVTSFAG